MKGSIRSQAIKRVSERLSKLSDKEFFKKLKKHENGDFAKIIRESGMLAIRSK